MRLKKKGSAPFAEGDMTPMIDMTFQLIAFFMVLVNFSDAEQDKRIHLPASEMAIPPDKPFEEQRTLQLTKEGTVLFGGDEVALGGLGTLLARERTVLVQIQGKAASDVTVIIRADASAKVGDVQEMIKICQTNGFEKFSLRAEQKEPGT